MKSKTKIKKKKTIKIRAEIEGEGILTCEYCGAGMYFCDSGAKCPDCKNFIELE